MSTRFSLAQVETAKANLDALPAANKDTREGRPAGGNQGSGPTILASRGYSRRKIIDLLREHGIPISTSTLEHYVGEKRARREAAGRPTSRSKAVETAGNGADIGPEPYTTPHDHVAAHVIVSARACLRAVDDLADPP